MTELDEAQRQINLEEVKILSRAGTVLYGNQWQTALSAAFAERSTVFDARTIRFWLSGDRPMPATVRPLLRKILEERLDQIAGVILELDVYSSEWMAFQKSFQK